MEFENDKHRVGARALSWTCSILYRGNPENKGLEYEWLTGQNQGDGCSDFYFYESNYNSYLFCFC
jgi:hypothetical protein